MAKKSIFTGDENSTPIQDDYEQAAANAKFAKQNLKSIPTIGLRRKTNMAEGQEIQFDIRSKYHKGKPKF